MRISDLILSLAVVAFAAVRPVYAEDAVNAPVYTVTYFDVAPQSAAKSAGLARQYADAGRKSDGNLVFDVYEEIGRPNRFAILEGWRDKKAADAHGASALTTGFHSSLQPLLIAGLGARGFSGLSIAAPTARPGNDAVYVLTHVDVFPAGKDQAVELVKARAEAGRKDDGNLWFDVLQWDGHPNHFTLVEAWRDHKAFDASVTAPQTKDFRQKITPLEGALYDERLYKVLR